MIKNKNIVDIRKIFDLLYDSFQAQGWWPIYDLKTGQSLYRKNFFGLLDEDEMLEISLGAILTQNTSWKNAEKAIGELKKNKFIDYKKILSSDEQDIALLIKSSGYYNQKAKKIKNFSLWIKKNGGKLSELKKKDPYHLREELLLINGVGKETADSILLYSFYLPFFVVDSYTKRVYQRVTGDHNDYEYDELREIFENSIEKNFKIYNEFHALLVKTAKDFCLKNLPVCVKCPLEKICRRYYE
ncbi:MAG: endonuclease [Elusimicrobia bacterium]|nr:endonuclease [Elusimicrobiota bacterium]